MPFDSGLRIGVKRGISPRAPLADLLEKFEVGDLSLQFAILAFELHIASRQLPFDFPRFRALTVCPSREVTQGRHMVPSSALQSKKPTWCFIPNDNIISRALSASDHANAAYMTAVPML